MPKVGVEPTWAQGPLRPERSASANSATSACGGNFTPKRGFVNLLRESKTRGRQGQEEMLRHAFHPHSAQGRLQPRRGLGACVGFYNVARQREVLVRLLACKRTGRLCGASACYSQFIWM